MVSRKGRSSLAPRVVVLGFIITLITVPAFLAACDSAGPQAQETATQLDRGDMVFARYCNVCHPGGRAGSGPALVSLMPRLSDAQIEQVVRHGKNRMPGYKETDISADDLAGLILYLRSMK